MKTYRVYFKKNGINLTKLVYAESLLEVLNQFVNMEVVMIKELDLHELFHPSSRSLEDVFISQQQQLKNITHFINELFFQL